MMSFFSRTAVAAAFLLAILPSDAGAQEVGSAPKVISQHGDWGVTCRADENGEGCALTQRRVSKQDREFIVELGINLVPTDAGPRPVLLAVVPEGVALQIQPGYSIDGSELVPLVWQVCFARVCRAYRPLSEAELAAVRAGSTLKLGFQAFGAERGLNVDFSLNGVTAGLRALEAR